MAAPRPLVLIHGYSDQGKSFERWATLLRERAAAAGRPRDVVVANYQSLTNEITIRDLAEGLDRSLRVTAGLAADEPFDAIVHSTGGLVIRSWLSAYDGRRDRLKNLVMLAPANFGSPMAHKGRGWLGMVFKGGRELGPDFMEAGDRILSGLELGSRFQWDLAHADMLGPTTFYGATKKTPYAFVFIGTSDYGWLKRLVTEPGTDGTVRWAACALNTRKITVDLTRDPSAPDGASRVRVAPWSNVDMPLTLVPGVNHGTILSDPPPELVDAVDSALGVTSQAEFQAWQAAARQRFTPRADEWQQFVVRCVDERGDPVRDYAIRFFSGPEHRERPVDEVIADVHAFRDDPSFRCFHVNLTRAKPQSLGTLRMRVIAESGTAFVGYHGYGSPEPTSAISTGAGDGARSATASKWDATVDLTPMLGDAAVSFFYPYTTTLVELVLNREPQPLTGRVTVFTLDPFAG